ncbi:MAG TPA: PspC domain-containing protein [Hyphomicrobiales bacterium]|nr:PspC domain-containing protein [Hyphomicrobiales bacterium]
MTLKSKRPLELDREHRKFLGVCAGLANYLEVPVWSVRLVFLGCVIFGAWFLVPLYFAMWFLLDESSAKVKETISDSHMVTHFKNVDYKKKLYRNTRDGRVLGVCAGVADYLEVSVFAVRMIFLLLVLFTVFPVLFYFGAALVIDKKPLELYYQEELRPAAAAAQAGRSRRGSQAQDVRNARARFSKRHEFQFCARRFAMLQTRLARMEAYVTSPRFHLNREFKNMA